MPQSALGPALNDQGYDAGRVERNFYWITDGTYESAAADAFTESTTFWVMDSIRLDLGHGSEVHP